MQSQFSVAVIKLCELCAFLVRFVVKRDDKFVKKKSVKSAFQLRLKTATNH